MSFFESPLFVFVNVEKKVVTHSRRLAKCLMCQLPKCSGTYLRICPRIPWCDGAINLKYTYCMLHAKIR